MKYCPKCKNKGFTPSENFSHPLVNKGKKNYMGFSHRYYGCMNCGARFISVEEVWKYIGEEQDLFSQGDK